MTSSCFNYISTDINQFKKTLDSNNLNQDIDLDQFHILMENWISEITEIEQDFHNIAPRDSQRLDDLIYSQSTLKSTFGHHLLKDYVESGTMGDSNSPSKCSLNQFSSTNKSPDKKVLEEQIQELEFQKKKMSEEMEIMKIELANSLETNENLKDGLEKAFKKINEDQKFVEELQQLINNKDDNEDELEELKKHSLSLEKKVLSLEIKIGDLNEELVKVLNENKKLEKKNQKLSKEKDKVFEEMTGLRTEIDAWKQDFASQRELFAIINEEKKNLEVVNKEYTCKIEKLKLEKSTLENLLKPITEISTENFTRSNSFSRAVKSSNIGNKIHSMDDFSKDSIEITDKLNKDHKLNCKCKELTLKINDLERENGLKHNKIIDLTLEIDQLKNKKENQQDEASKINEELKSEKSEIEIEQQRLEDVLGFLEQERASLKVEIKAHSTKIIKLEENEKVLKQKLMILRFERDNLVMKSSTIQVKLEALKSKTDSIGIIEVLKAEKHQIEIEKQLLENVLSSLEEEMASLNLEIQTNLTKIMKLEENDIDLKHEMTVLQFERDNLVMKFSTMQVKLSESDDCTVKSSNSTLKMKQRDLNELKLKLENVKKEQELENYLDQKEKISQNEKKYEKLQEKFENLQKSYQKLSEMFEKNKKEFNVVKIDHEKCEENNRKLSQENSKTLIVCQKKLAQSLQDNEQTFKEKVELKSKIEKLNRNLKFNELKLKKIEIKNIEQLEECKNTINCYKEINDKLSKTNEELEKLIEKKDKLINEIKKENNESIKKEEAISLKEAKENINEELFLCKEMCENYRNKIEKIEILVDNLRKKVETKDFLLNEQELKLAQLQKEIDLKCNELKEITEKFERLKKKKEKSNEKINELQKDVEKKNNENKKLKTLLNNHEEILGKLKKIFEENEHLKVENKFSEEEKSKMIEEINKSFSETIQKYKTEDCTSYSNKKEIEKYKKENKSYENEIMILLKEKESFLDRLKCVENELEETKIEMEITKSELKMVLAKKDLCSSHNLYESKKKLTTKRLNYDKLMFKNEKLEQKVLDLQDQLSVEKKVLTEAISKRKLIENELKNLNEENLQLEQQLRARNNYFKDVNIDKIMTEIEKYKKNVFQNRINLEKNSFTVATYFSVPNDLMRKIFKNKPSFKISERFLTFDNKMFKVKEQMDISSNVLNYLCLKISKITIQNGLSQTENVEKNNGNEVSQRKSGFVLKPVSFLPKIHPMESLQFASSGDAGKSDHGVVFSKQQEKQDHYGLQNNSQEENVLPSLNEEILQNLGLINTNLKYYFK